MLKLDIGMPQDVGNGEEHDGSDGKSFCAWGIVVYDIWWMTERGHLNCIKRRTMKLWRKLTGGSVPTPLQKLGQLFNPFETYLQGVS